MSICPSFLLSSPILFRLPLEQLTAFKTVELRCISDEREIQVPVPERWDLKRMAFLTGVDHELMGRYMSLPADFGDLIDNARPRKSNSIGTVRVGFNQVGSRQ